jgi:hypothetical protein
MATVVSTELVGRQQREAEDDAQLGPREALAMRPMRRSIAVMSVSSAVSSTHRGRRRTSSPTGDEG